MSTTLGQPWKVRRGFRRRCRHPLEPAISATTLTITGALALEFDHGSKWIDEEALASHMVRQCGVGLTAWTSGSWRLAGAACN